MKWSWGDMDGVRKGKNKVYRVVKLLQEHDKPLTGRQIRERLVTGGYKNVPTANELANILAKNPRFFRPVGQVRNQSILVGSGGYINEWVVIPKDA